LIRRLIILALIVAGGWWYWTQWRPAHDYKKLSGRLESAINEELVRAGLTDKHVSQTLRLERSRVGLTWIETHRRIETSPQTLPKLLDKLSAIAQKLGVSTLKRENTPSGAVLELGKGPFLLQRLEFVPPRAAEAPKAPEVALVIDDVAYDVSIMDSFAALGVPLTFAILPRDKHSKALAERAVELNFPVILHMPMEPLDLAHNNPGPAGLYLKMNPRELQEQFERNIASVPHIQGINNHMGSAFTVDTAKMTLVMKWLKEKNLFFLDSHTNIKSVGSKVAKQVGVPCLINETFLDNEDDAKAIERQLDIVLKLALQRKRTIAIGHYRRKHLVEALANKLPEFRARGVNLVGLPAFYPKS
jgi:uncharacterized protein